MIDLSPQIITVIMMGGLLALLFTGLHIAVIIGSLALIVGFLVFGERAVASIMYLRAYDIMTNYNFLAVPLFVFMGNMLEYSGIAEKVFATLDVFIGRFRGGMAVATILLGTVMAACVGVISASVAMLTLVCLPAMVKRGYDKGLASGAVCAGGTLGILIPPSVMLILYGPMAQISVGKLFFGAFFPGFILAALYCIYIGGLSFLKPELAPAFPKGERVPLSRKMSMFGTSMVPVVILVLAVLGVIYLGIATPTEASAVGCLAATLLTLAYGKLNWHVVKDTAIGTVKLAGMIMFIGLLANGFTGVFLRAGCGEVMKTLILAAPGGRWGVFAIIMVIVFLLGFAIDWVAIVFIMVPIITPIGTALGFDPVWFAMMVCVNLQTAFLTPPMAGALFVCRGMAAPELGLTMNDLIRGVWGFVVCVLIGLVLCVSFPGIITWLPGKMIQ